MIGVQSAIDMVCWYPFIISVWLFLLEFGKKANAHDAIESAKTNMPPNYPRFISFWVPVNMISYRYVPIKQRVLFLMSINFIWHLIIIFANDKVIGHAGTEDQTQSGPE
jgi:hypothetical protein